MSGPPHYRADPRLAGMGLGFLLGEEDGHRTAGHTGTLSGFLSAISLAPDDGIAVIVLASTGGLSGRGPPRQLAPALLSRRLGAPGEAIRTGIPARPENWSELCGWYSPEPGPVTNLCLYPDDPSDPQVFRADFTELGFGTFRVVFTGGPESGAAGMRLLVKELPFRKRPAIGTRGYGRTALLLPEQPRWPSAAAPHPGALRLYPWGCYVPSVRYKGVRMHFDAMDVKLPARACQAPDGER